MTLLFYVNNQTLSLAPGQENIEIVADSKNYLKVKFVFQTKEWKTSALKYALFSQGGKTYKKYLGIEDNTLPDECYVAPEVIKAGGFTVSVFCEDLITTNTVNIAVKQSGYTENIENQQITPNVIEQMNTLMYKYASLCNNIYKECENVYQNLKEVNK